MVVSDSSALINLARIGKLALLRDLYVEVHIPEAVWEEAVVNGEGQAGANEIKAAPWVKAHRVKNSELVKALRQELDAGEAEAIALALETHAERLLMDERLGRDTARHLGLRFTRLRQDAPCGSTGRNGDTRPRRSPQGEDGFTSP